MSEFDRQLARGTVIEEKLNAYLRALGYRVLSTARFSGHGAPKLEANDREDSLTMPDALAYANGCADWWESKYKTNASATDRLGGRLVTGIDFAAWEQYRAVERDTQQIVNLVFVHEKEREVRCASLQQLSFIESHRSDRMGKGGMVFWDYERIPLWMSLAELGAAIEAYRLQANLVLPPIKPPVQRLFLSPNLAAGRIAHRRPKACGVFAELSAPWTWTHLSCNATGTGNSTKHTCKHDAPSLRHYWIRRITFALPNHDAKRAAEIVDAPIQLSALARLLGGNWMKLIEESREVVA